MKFRGSAPSSSPARRDYDLGVKLKVTLYPAMRHFPDGDRYEFHGHLSADRTRRVMITIAGQPRKTLYERFLGTEDPDTGFYKGEDKIDLEVEQNQTQVG